MNKKSDYISPEVDVFTLLSEGVVCQSTGTTSIDDWQNGGDFPNVF